MVVLVGGGCVSAPAPVDEQCRFGTVAQGLSSRCYSHSLGPVTDPDDPEFGRVPCEIVEFGNQGSDFCNCATAGYRPATPAQSQVALEALTSEGACQETCCDSLCFCELLQLSGTELQACQQGESASIALDTPGFCYVEPGVGVGDASSIDGCPKSQPQRIILTPLGSSHQAIVSCEATLR